LRNGKWGAVWAKGGANACTVTVIRNSVTVIRDRDRDRYGRLLRNVQVDGADVGEKMVGDGVAREYGSGGGRGADC
jgi:endonuclease YncB( thermonuclease family)